MISINEIVQDLDRILHTRDVPQQRAQEFILHSFIAGVCFERLSSKSERRFRKILDIISSFKLMLESKMIVEQNIWEIYEKVAIQDEEIKDQYHRMQYFQEISRETQQFYTSRPKQQIVEQQIKCTICLEIIPKQEMKTLSCKDSFHNQCLNQFVLSQLQNKQWPFKCPVCKKEINQSDTKELVGDNVMQRVFDLSMQNYVQHHSDEVSSCPTAGCSFVFIPNNQSLLRCPLCKKNYCLKCKVEFHEQQTCKQYMESEKAKQDRELDDQFLKCVQGANYKQCPQCKHWVEKIKGCDHMTCRCKFEFCYKCGGVYKKCQCVR